jgi:hypothetical protein
MIAGRRSADLSALRLTLFNDKWKKIRRDWLLANRREEIRALQMLHHEASAMSRSKKSVER